MKRLGLALFLILTGSVLAWAQWSDWKANHDWKTVERLVGYPGQAEGDGFKISVPRLDLNVLVHGSWVDPRAGLASWFAFKPLAHGNLLIGEMVLTDWEVPRVETLLATGPLTLTSIYRPFNGETPGVERVGFMGKGSRVLLAQEAEALLAATSMPLVPPPSVLTPPTPAQTAFGLPLEKILGPGQWAGGAFSFSFVPPAPVTNEGIEIPSYMGLETGFHFQPDGKQAKVYGQWVLTRAEARKVIESLMKNKIEITNTHSELFDQSPAMVYLDFWAEGEPLQLAKTIKEAVQQTQLVGWTPGSLQNTRKP
jgi:Domain of Unknown Function (DUF1259)